jgi:hypothetical protein
MKRRLLFLITPLVLFIGCSTSVSLKKEMIISDLDFRPYSEKGFLFTTETYTESDYNAIGLMEITLRPGVWTNPNANVIFDRFDAQEGLDSLYQYASKRGADAIMNFRIEWRQLHVMGVSEAYPTFSGFAIKRLK